MENVPKIVRERLKVATPVVNHPDADALTAFVEQSLPERERTGMLEHLSRCADCREIVALALPSDEPGAMMTESPSRFLVWPTLRWGFAAAGLFVIVSLGVLQYRRLNPETVARNAPQQAPTEGRNQSSPPTSAPEPVKAKEDKANAPVSFVSAGAPTRKDSLADAKALPHPEPAGTGGAEPITRSSADSARRVLPHGPGVMNQWQQNANVLSQNVQSQNVQSQNVQAPMVVPVAPSPSAKQTLSREGNANVPAPAPPSSTSPEADTLTENQVQTSAQPRAAFDYAEARVEKTKPAETTANGAGPRMETASVPALAGRAFKQLATLSPTWRISSNGGLQRSLDQGNSWQDVDVLAAAATTNLKAATKTSLAATKKSVPDLESLVTFRAVAANGADVWAGGSGARLYHSGDAGNHWGRVVPFSGSALLTGDVLSIDFPDSQHGRVSTSTSEVWTTSDGGQSWQQQ